MDVSQIVQQVAQYSHITLPHAWQLLPSPSGMCASQSEQLVSFQLSRDAYGLPLL